MKEPKIVVSRILFDTMLNLNGEKVYVTGRTGDRILCKHNYQLSVNLETEQYIKDITKYLNRCKLANKEIEIGKASFFVFAPAK